MEKKLLLTIAILLTAASGARADDSGSCGNSVTYSYVESTRTLTISGTGDMADYYALPNVPWNDYKPNISTVVIGDGVTRIGKLAFQNCTSLTSATIPNSVTSIGESAFEGCTSLASVAIPSKVSMTGSYAFYGCTSLTSVNIPASLTSIGDNSFTGCSALETITVDGNNPRYNSFGDCNAIIETAENTLLYGCKNTVIPSGVTKIGAESFYGCTGLTSIEIPGSVTDIGNYAFYGCTGLSSIEIPEGVTTIWSNAFNAYTGDHVYVVVPEGKQLIVTIDGVTDPVVIEPTEGKADILDCLFADPVDRTTSRALILSNVITVYVTTAAGEGEAPNVEYFSDFFDAVTAANAATSDCTVTLLDDVDLDETGEFNNINIVGTGDAERKVRITLDLNGHCISGGEEHETMIKNYGLLTIINSSTDTGSFSANTGVLDIIKNEDGGELSVNGVTFTGWSTYAIDNDGFLTINDMKISGPSIGIQSSGDLILNGWPTFSTTALDIDLTGDKMITFGDDFAVPATEYSPIKVNFNDAFPRAITSGYAAHCKDGNGNVLDPADVFTISGANIVLAGGEAVAYDPDKPLVAVNTASDGSITGLYAKDGTTYTTDAAALTAAVDALADGETLTLCKDVIGVETIIIMKGTATAPVTLDLNGKTISGDAKEVIEVDGNATLMISSTGGGGKISNTKTNADYFNGITNYGAVNITGCTVETASPYASAIAVVNGGTLSANGTTFKASGDGGNGVCSFNQVELTNCTMSGTFRGVYVAKGTATITGGSISGYQHAGIFAEEGTVTLTAWPTFSGNDIDIDLKDGLKIVLGEGFAVPATVNSPIKVNAAGDVPFPITSGYAAHCKDGNGNVLDPAKVFTVSGANIVLAGGEAVAYDPDMPLVAVNTASDGSITGLYAKDGTTYTTDAAALTAAVTAANAATGDVTVTLLDDVDLGTTGIVFNNTNTVGSGADERPVKMTLDLNGKTITGSGDEAIEIAVATDVTIVSSAEGGKVSNGAYQCDGIANSGTLTVSGIDIFGSEIGIYNIGTLTITDCNVRGRYHSGIHNSGQVTVSGGSFYGSDEGIYSNNDVTFTAWPTFSGNITDIYLYISDDEEVFPAKIVFGDGFKVPATEYNKIKITVKATGDDPLTIPLTITSGYAAHCKDGQNNVLDPYDVFTLIDEYHALGLQDGEVVVVKIPTMITIEKDALELAVLDEVSTGATLTPSDAGSLVYTSSNESVAIVSEGMIEAVGVGTATITVSFAGNDTYAAAESKTISIAVSLNETSVSVNDLPPMALSVGDEFVLVPTTTPDGLNVTYIPDNSGVVSVDENGVVTALKDGTAEITVTVGDGKVYAKSSTTVTLTVSTYNMDNLFVGDNVWTGFVAEKDLRVPYGLTAYVVTALGAETATATPIEYIPKDVPVLLKREDKTVNSYKTGEDIGTPPDVNLLQVASTTNQPKALHDYVLYQDAFVLVSGGTLATGKVFLPVPQNQSRAAARAIVIDGETTSLSEMDVEVAESEEWFDLQGRKLDGKPTRKGVYIHNGKKEVVR